MPFQGPLTLADKFEYQGEIEGHQISATTYNPFRQRIFSLHEEVGVRFDSRAIKILKEEGSAMKPRSILSLFLAFQTALWGFLWPMPEKEGIRVN